MTRTPSALPFPSPSSDDTSDVSVALEAARALWDNGEIEEALRWLGRAVESTEQAGNDRRALELARAVADLKDALAPKPPPPPAAASPKPSMKPPPPPLPPAAPTAASPSVQPAPAVASIMKTAPPAPSSRKSLPPTPPSMRPRPPEAPPAPKTDAAVADRLRVSVKSSVRDPDLLLVRVLPAGQPVPSGCHEAFLSPAQTGIDLRRLRT